MYFGSILFTLGLLQAQFPSQPPIVLNLPEIKSAGYSMPLRIRFAPGQVLTLFVPGLKVPSLSTTADTLPLPTTLEGVTVTGLETSRPGGFNGSLPILAITNAQYFGGLWVEGPKLTAVTVQMPAVEFCPPEASPNPCWYIPVLSVTVLQAGVPVASSEMVAVSASPHVLNSCDSSVAPFLPDALKVGQLLAECDPIVAHADGTVVTGRNPAQLGETVSIYATGLGWGITSALIGTPTPNEGIAGDVSAVRVGFDFNISIDPTPSDVPVQTEPAYVGLTGGLVGIYQINVTLPDLAPTDARSCAVYGDNVGINLRFTGFNTIVPVQVCVRF